MIYIDNNATTPIDPEVYEAMKPYLTVEYGNPSSKYYKLAVKAEEAVNEAREKIARLINAEPKEIIFTSSATESNNFIIKGVADYKKYYEAKGNHIITSSVEHKSIINTCRFLDGQIYMNKEKNKFAFAPERKIDRGYEVTFLKVNKYGQVELEELEKNIKENTILVSIMWGNNEIGSINDIEKLVAPVKAKGILFHSDATQVLGRMEIDVKKVPVDFLSFSAHKLYGPKGIAACYIRSGKYSMPNLTSLIHGGDNQEYGYRAGTLSVHNIVGFGKAAEIAARDMKEYTKKLRKLEIEFKRLIQQKFDEVEFLGDPDNHIPGVVSMIIPEIHNETFIKKLADKVALSSGSACSIVEPSYVLEAIGKKEYTTNFIRVSFGKFNDYEDIEKLEKILSSC